MPRQTASRSQRSKGIKVKHVLQICVLLAICFWLMFQLKRSHEKKKEFDASDVKSSISGGNSDVLIRLGRKDIHPKEEDTVAKNEKHVEEAEEEETTGDDADDNKREEVVLEDKKIEDTENEKIGGADDEIEDHAQEKSDTKVDREEDLVDDEKERDDGVENEENEDGDGQVEKESSTDKGDHDGDDTGTHEAREEHYKADDASSAVTHDSLLDATEGENQNDENVGAQPKNILEETNLGDKRMESEEGAEIAIDEKQSNLINGGVKENVIDVPENSSSLNTTYKEVSDDNPKTSSSSIEISTETHDQEILSEGTSLEKSNLQSNNSSLLMDEISFGSNSTGPDESKDSESNTFKLSEISNNSDSSIEMDDARDTEKSAENDGENEILEDENTKNSEEIPQDSIDLSDSFHSMAEIDTRVDLDTLPEIQTEGTNTEDAA